MKKRRIYYEHIITTLIALYLEPDDLAIYRDKAKMKLNTLMSEYSFYYNFQSKRREAVYKGFIAFILKMTDEKGKIQMNKEMLRSIMVLNGDTNKELAEYLEISEASVSAKMNENKTEFKQKEIAKIRDKYNLSAEQIEAIFFA